MSKLSPGAIKNYIEDGGNHCPYCRSDSIKAFNHDWDEVCAYNDVLCHICGERWTDVYKLVEVTYEDD